jgi:hypothetical protein
LAALALLALPGCGGGDDPAGAAQTDAQAARQPPPPSPAEVCRSQLGGFVTALDRLRERLVVGVSYRQYIGELQAVRSYYDRLPVARLEVACLAEAATAAERSFNKYLEAAGVWSDCVEVPGCQSISIEAELQRKWRRGARLLSQVESTLSPSDK